MRFFPCGWSHHVLNWKLNCHLWKITNTSSAKPPVKDRMIYYVCGTYDNKVHVVLCYCHPVCICMPFCSLSIMLLLRLVFVNVCNICAKLWLLDSLLQIKHNISWRYTLLQMLTTCTLNCLHLGLPPDMYDLWSILSFDIIIIAIQIYCHTVS